MAELIGTLFYHCVSAVDYKVEHGTWLVRFDRHHHRNPDVQTDWSCTCPSYKFERGLDLAGYCKHIRAAKPGRCGWMQFSDGQEPVDGKCPKCGGPVEAMTWGV